MQAKGKYSTAGSGTFPSLYFEPWRSGRLWADASASFPAHTISEALIRLQQWMKDSASAVWMTEQDQRITAAFRQEQGRLRNFIRRRVANETEVEDILQDVFYELVAAYRLMKPIEQVSAWL